MNEPVAIVLTRVLNAKGEPIPDLTLVRPQPLADDEESTPWLPERLLIDPSLAASIRTLFPGPLGATNETVEVVPQAWGGKRSVLALYGPPPKITEKVQPAPVEEAPVEPEAPSDPVSEPVPVGPVPAEN